MFRCLRKYKNNKIGKIFIWCNEYNETCNILSSIKEYDNITTKVHIINSSITKN